MRILYLDCFSGISGDMSVAALLDLGLDESKFLNELAKLKLDGYRVEIKKKLKCGIMGTDFNVILDGEHEHGHEHEHEHEHVHEHEHEHEHENEHSQTQAHSHEHEHRNLLDIEKIIDASTLSSFVKHMSKKIFREVAVAESRVHGKTIEDVHFHEVGAIDSIIDIVGAAICIDMLAVDAVFASALHDGQGTIECAHGTMPVPVPAVMEMLKDTGIPLIIEDVQTELITPTGMAIIKTLAQSFGKMPSMEIETLGYGIGKRETGKFNALRAVVGNTATRALADKVIVIETNIDNTSPEIIGYTVDKLLEKGALDVYQIPIQMKKNRAGVLLGVICSEGSETELSKIIFAETGSIGVRTYPCERFVMERASINVKTSLGEARVKVSGHGTDAKFAPEFEDCRELAIKNGIPIRQVYECVAEQARLEQI